MAGGYLPSYWDPDDVLYCVAKEVGGAFVLGGAGGTAYHFVRGLVRGRRLAASVHAACANAPRVAAGLAAFCAVFSTIESAAYLAHGRQYTMSGMVTTTTASFGLEGLRRGGVPAAARWAFLGPSILLAIFEYSQYLGIRDSENSIDPVGDI